MKNNDKGAQMTPKTIKNRGKDGREPRPNQGC